MADRVAMQRPLIAASGFIQASWTVPVEMLSVANTLRQRHSTTKDGTKPIRANEHS